MPEIPEMEIYKNYLNQWVTGRTVAGVHVQRPRSLNLPVEDFQSKVAGKRIGEVGRKGKFLWFSLGQDTYLLTHMMLEGRLFLLPPREIPKEVLDFTDGGQLKKEIEGLPGRPSVVLILSDESILFFCTLTLGYLHYLTKDKLDAILDEIGEDPLHPNFTAEALSGLLKGRRGMIKPWLMNQKYLAGIGNAYSNEALFGAGILPVRQIGAFKPEEMIALHRALQTILREAINLGGDMEEPFAPWDKFTGGYIKDFKVYDREGQPCLVCSDTILKEEVGGRNAFFCPTCQT